MKYRLKLLLIITITLLLTSCSTINPPEYQNQLHKLSQFNQPFYVYETRDWRPGIGGLHLQPVHSKNRLYPYKFPSLQDYSQSKNAWYAWHNTDLFNKFEGNEYRILGLVDRNTTYRLDKVVEFSFSGSTHEEITITSGPFAGKQVKLQTWLLQQWEPIHG